MPGMTDTIPQEKLDLQAQINQQKQEFYRRGGKIQYIDHGDVNADPRQIGPLSDSAAWEKRRGEFTINHKN